MRVRLIVSAALAAAATYSALIREAAPTLNRRPHRDGQEPPVPDEPPALASVRVTHVPVEASAPVEVPRDDADDPIAALARSILERVGTTAAPQPEIGSAVIESTATTRLNRWLKAPVAVAGAADQPGGPVAIAQYEEVRQVRSTGPRLVTSRSADGAVETPRTPFRSRVRNGADLTLAPAPAEPIPDRERPRQEDSCDALIGPVRRSRRSAATRDSAPIALIGSRPVRRSTTEESPMPTLDIAPPPIAAGRFALGAIAANPGDMTLTAVTFDAPVAAEVTPGAIVLDIDSATNMATGGLRVLDGQGFAPNEDGFALMLTATEPGPFAVTGTYRVSA